jgi:hypothetical protein
MLRVRKVWKQYIYNVEYIKQGTEAEIASISALKMLKRKYTQPREILFTHVLRN